MLTASGPALELPLNSPYSAGRTSSASSSIYIGTGPPLGKEVASVGPARGVNSLVTTGNIAESSLGDLDY